jgi:hypothetical protein
MKAIVKSAMVVGLTGGLALAAVSASDARSRYGAYGYDAYAYDPYYVAPAPVRRGYAAYGYAPRYYGRSDTTASWPPHHDPGYGYNSNTISPWKDRELQGRDE